jgi:murein L,D-transpeptidase YcbB/YkuD
MTSIAVARRGLFKRAILVAGLGATIAIGAPFPALAGNLGPPPPAQLREALADRADELQVFYAARGHRPLWLVADGRAGPAVGPLLDRLETAHFDALGDNVLKRLRTRDARRALDRARSGKPKDVARAELELSSLFSQYVRATRAGHRAPMLYESAALAPAIPSVTAALAAAAKSPSLEEYVLEMGWMHPFYAPLRDAMDTRAFNEDQRRTIWENLERVRALPANPADRYVLVDAASARLWMYEDGKPVDSMRVVVGKPESPTPTMAGFMRYAIVNPYWNVPPDLVQRNIAPNVIDRGVRYLRQNTYEVLADFSENPAQLDPAKVDWKAVAQGLAPPPRVRQKPGGPNFMGKVKFEFPNDQGIYLHDTPERALLKLDERQLSNGCVRLEDADRFGRWLLGKALPKAARAKPEQRIDLPTLVPVYITYLTALPTEHGIAFRSDVYGLDGQPRFAHAGE